MHDVRTIWVLPIVYRKYQRIYLHTGCRLSTTALWHILSRDMCTDRSHDEACERHTSDAEDARMTIIFAEILRGDRKPRE